RRANTRPESCNLPARRIEPIEPALSADPQRTIAPLGYGENPVVAQRCAVRLSVFEATYATRGDVELHESGGARRDPKVPVVIEMQRADFLLGRHGRLSGGGTQRDEAAGHRVAPGDSASVRADPQPAGCVAGKCGNPIVGQTACHPALANRVLQRVAVVATQPIFGAEPE